MRSWVFIVLLAAGCETLSPFTSTEKKSNVVSTALISPNAHASAARLDNVGRQIISTNPFLTSAPAFAFVGSQAPEIFHQNAEAVFVSEGVITKCQSDDQLAALLCVELARITMENRNLARIGLAQPDTTLPGAQAKPDEEQADLGGGDRVGQASNPMMRIQSITPANAMEFAAELHKNAGYKPEAFTEIKSLLTESEKNSIIAKQLGGAGSVPQWTR